MFIGARRLVSCLFTSGVLLLACDQGRSDIEPPDDHAAVAIPSGDPGVAEAGGGNSVNIPPDDAGKTAADSGATTCMSGQVDCMGQCDGTSVVDCAGKCNGSAKVDCLGTCAGEAVLDDCGVCNGNNIMRDCMGVCDGPAVVDCSGECGGSAKSDCANTCNGTALLDCDGVCAGTNLGVLNYPDDDSDGFGVDIGAQRACQIPIGRVGNKNDCNDVIAGCTIDCKACRGFLSLPSGIKLTSTASGLGATLPNAGISAIGNVDGDTQADLALGDRILFLNANGTVKSNRTITASDLGGAILSAGFGTAVAGLGDIDGDGVPDLAISDPTYVSALPANGNQVEDGRVWVLRLNPDGSVKAATSHFYPWQSATQSSRGYRNPNFGYRLASADLDSNGSRELIATVRTNSDLEPGSINREAGRLEIFTLNPDGSLASRVAIDHDASQFADGDIDGCSVVVLPDLDGNGVLDLAIGSPRIEALWTVLLTPSFGVKAVKRIDASQFSGGLGATYSGTSFGSSLALVGDVDQDGTPEIAVTYGKLGAEGGLVLVSLGADGSATMFSPVAERFDSLAIDLNAGDAFATTLASLGDIDSDGALELLATAPGDDQGGIDNGALWLLGFETQCGPGFNGDCDANPVNGCETQLTSTAHCGACGRTCSGREHSSGGACGASGQCTLACDGGWLDCNGLPGDGCELDQSGASYANVASVDCSGSGVSLTCASGYGDCDGNQANGCETALLDNVTACGSCGKICPVVLGRSPQCAAGQCGSSTQCDTKFSDCDADTSNGCESCAVNCSQGGSFPAPAVCGIDQVCTLQEFVFDLNRIPFAECVMSCPIGKGDCDKVAINGCEQNLTTEASCGNCITYCPTWEWRSYCVLNAEQDGYRCN